MTSRHRSAFDLFVSGMLIGFPLLASSSLAAPWTAAGRGPGSRGQELAKGPPLVEHATDAADEGPENETDEGNGGSPQRATTLNLRITVTATEDDETNPVEDAAVTVAPLEGENAEKTTDGKGEVTFKRLPVGKAVITAIGSGYKTYRSTVTLSAQSPRLEIRLKKRDFQGAHD